MNKNKNIYLFSWFNDYVKSYYSEANYMQMNIQLKEEHTYRVCDNILSIGKGMNLEQDQLRMAEITALFHDIGRFEQFKKYRTFNDKISENHAKLAVEILNQNSILNKLPGNERNLIYKAILFHNVHKLPENESYENLFYTKLLRDADKLDILWVVTDYYEKRELYPNPAMELELPDNEKYSKYIINEIINCKCASNNHIKTYNDMKLLQISWVFDINFVPTYRAINNYGYIDKIIHSLPDTDDIKMIHKHTDECIRKKLKDSN